MSHPSRFIIEDDKIEVEDDLLNVTAATRKILLWESFLVFQLTINPDEKGTGKEQKCIFCCCGIGTKVVA